MLRYLAHVEINGNEIIVMLFNVFLKKCAHCKFKNLNNQGRLKLFSRDAIHCDQSLIQNEPFVDFSVNDENNICLKS